MLPKVKELEHNRIEALKAEKDPSYVMVPYVKPKTGRPSKQRLKAAGQVRGRPKETEGRIAEFKERLLATKGNYIIDKVVQIALDDKHPNQIAALKMCIDRALPLSYFEKHGNSKGHIQINIVNATEEQPTIDIQSTDVEDVEDIDAET